MSWRLRNNNSLQEWATTNAFEPVLRPLIAYTKPAPRVKCKCKRLFAALDRIEIMRSIMEKDQIVSIGVRELIWAEWMDPADVARVLSKMLSNDVFNRARSAYQVKRLAVAVDGDGDLRHFV